MAVNAVAVITVAANAVAANVVAAKVSTTALKLQEVLIWLNFAMGYYYYWPLFFFFFFSCNLFSSECKCYFSWRFQDFFHYAVLNNKMNDNARCRQQKGPFELYYIYYTSTSNCGWLTKIM